MAILIKIISTMGQIYRMHTLSKEIQDPAFHLELFQALIIYSESFALRFGVHGSLFNNVIQMLGSKEQQEQWVENIQDIRMIGCFAMVNILFCFV